MPPGWWRVVVYLAVAFIKNNHEIMFAGELDNGFEFLDRRRCALRVGGRAVIGEQRSDLGFPHPARGNQAENSFPVLPAQRQILAPASAAAPKIDLIKRVWHQDQRLLPRDFLRDDCERDHEESFAGAGNRDYRFIGVEHVARQVVSRRVSQPATAALNSGVPQTGGYLPQRSPLSARTRWRISGAGCCGSPSASDNGASSV